MVCITWPIYFPLVKFRTMYHDARSRFPELTHTNSRGRVPPDSYHYERDPRDHPHRTWRSPRAASARVRNMVGSPTRGGLDRLMSQSRARAVVLRLSTRRARALSHPDVICRRTGTTGGGGFVVGASLSPESGGRSCKTDRGIPPVLRDCTGTGEAVLVVGSGPGQRRSRSGWRRPSRRRLHVRCAGLRHSSRAFVSPAAIWAAGLTQAASPPRVQAVC